MKNKSWKFLIVYFLIFQITITSVGFVFAESEVIPKTPLVDTSAAAKTSSSSIKNISKKFVGEVSKIGCKKNTTRIMGGALGAARDAMTEKATEKASEGIDKLVKKKLEGGIIDEPVKVEDANVAKSVAATEANTADIAAKAAAAEVRAECLNSLAYKTAKFALAALTKRTVKWIDSGFNGDPFFISDQDTYMLTLKNKKVEDTLKTTSKWINRVKYPFARDYARTLLKNRTTTYEQKSQSNLNRYMSGSTTQEYVRDFNKGGWSGWLALTQNPSNNPLGYNIITSQNITDEAAQATQSALNELNWGDGFLSQKKCVNPSNYTPKSRKTNPCIKWETVTPGITISNQLSKAMGTSFNQLEMADEINESLSLVFDALANQAMLAGVKALTKGKDPSYETFGGPGDNKIYDINGKDITTRSGLEYDEQGTQINNIEASGWGVESFDITGLNNSENNLFRVIETQKNYLKQIKKSYIQLPKILPTVLELDYCIPGPHFGWEKDLQREIDKQDEDLNAVRSGTIDIKKDEKKQPWLKFTDYVPYLGDVVSGIVDLVEDVNYRGSHGGESKQETKDRLIAIKEAETDLRENLLEYYSKMRPEVIAYRSNEYKEKIYETYGENMTSKNIPSATKAKEITSDITGYVVGINKGIDTYKKTIDEVESNITRLETIKKKVDAIMRKQYVKDQIGICKQELEEKKGGDTPEFNFIFYGIEFTPTTKTNTLRYNMDGFISTEKISGTMSGSVIDEDGEVMFVEIPIKGRILGTVNKTAGIPTSFTGTFSGTGEKPGNARDIRILTVDLNGSISGSINTPSPYIELDGVNLEADIFEKGRSLKLGNATGSLKGKIRYLPLPINQQINVYSGGGGGNAGIQ